MFQSGKMNDKHFADFSGKVIVVDPSGPVRQLLTDVVRGFGFTEVQGCANIKDAFDFLEVELASWVITPMMADQPVNALHLLKTCTIHPVLKDVRVSLLLEESEYYVLDKAFELGMLSWHKKPFTKDSLAEDLEHLKTVMEKADYNETLTAAQYLRDYLDAQSESEKRLAFEKSLVKLFPGNGQVLIDLAVAQSGAGHKEVGMATLRQAKMINQDLAEEVDKVAQELFGEEGLKDPEDSDSVPNIINLKNVVVVDSDDSVSQALKEILEGLGVENIHTFADGEEAFNWITSNEEADAIIHEWRVPKLTGPMLIQRIRQHGHLEVPLITVSSLIKQEDLPLIREMGVANLVQKPLVKEKFVSQFIWTINQERTPSNQQSLERKIRQLLAGNKIKDAKKFQKQLNADKTIPAGHKLKIEAEFCFVEEDFDGAKEKGIAALKQTGDSIVLLNLLGKTFMKLHDFEASLKCFKKAQELSPKNIERLCHMAEVQTELGDDKGATDALDAAKNLDKDNAAIKTQEADRAVKTGNVEAAKQIMNEMDSVSDFVAYLNNKAVAHARCGYVEEGIDLYYKTLKAISDDRKHLVPIVRYNLALAKIRNSDLEQAVQQLDKVIKSEEKRVTKKAHSLKIRLEKAIQAGEEFKLAESEIKDNSSSVTKADPTGATSDTKESKKSAKDAKKAASSEESQHAELVAAVEANSGDLCCFKLFVASDESEEVKALLTSLPRFSHRGAIERQEALGAERMVKSAS